MILPLITTLLTGPSVGKNLITPHTIDKDDAQIIYVCIPTNASFKLQPILTNSLETLPKLAKKSNQSPVAAINGGFFDPKNKQTTSYVVVNNKVVLNPLKNDRLTQNSSLKPLMEKILNRSEFRILQCGQQQPYQITKHYNALPNGCKLVHSIQAGPNLFETQASEEEAFTAKDENGNLSRDSIGINRKNARSAVGIDAEGNIILAIATMKPINAEKASSGLTLKEMSNVMKELGASQALSLDGGSSTSLWVEGQIFYGKRNQDNQYVKRPIKSALLVTQEAQSNEK